MMVPSRTDPRRGMHTRLYTCRCVDFGSTNTSFRSERFMNGVSRVEGDGLRWSCRRSYHPRQIIVNLTLRQTPLHLGPSSAANHSILEFCPGPIRLFSADLLGAVRDRRRDLEPQH